MLLFSQKLAKIFFFYLLYQWKTKSLYSNTQLTKAGPTTLLTSSLTALSFGHFASVTLTFAVSWKKHLPFHQPGMFSTSVVIQFTSSLPTVFYSNVDVWKMFSLTTVKQWLLLLLALFYPLYLLYFSLSCFSILDIQYIWFGFFFCLSLLTHKLHEDRDFALFLLNA